MMTEKGVGLKGACSWEAGLISSRTEIAVRFAAASPGQ